VKDEQGLTGVVPFRFECKRSGNCCKVTGGYAWVEEHEVEPLAQAAGLESAVFAEKHLRRVSDPASGELRTALRDGEASRCSLLEGANHCSVYEARPKHCRDFPYWTSVLSDPAAFERARSICPGMEPVMTATSRERAFAGLEAIYRDVARFVEMAAPICIVRGKCCRFEEVGHRLYATRLEADYAADRQPSAPAPEAEGRCPYHVKGLCTAREARPLGCRTYFCDTRTTSVLEEAHEHFLDRIRELEAETAYPHAYASFPEQLRDRGVGATEGVHS